MALTTILIIIGIGLFLSIMAVAIALPIRPEIIRITGRFICPPGSGMDAQAVKLSYHRPGERGLVVTCERDGKTEIVTMKAFFCLWLIFFVCLLPVAVVLGLLARGFWAAP